MPKLCEDGADIFKARERDCGEKKAKIKYKNCLFFGNVEYSIKIESNYTSDKNEITDNSDHKLNY